MMHFKMEEGLVMMQYDWLVITILTNQVTHCSGSINNIEIVANEMLLIVM